MVKKPKITKSGLEVDLTGVEASERRRKRRIPEGNYRAKVDKVYPNKFKTGSRGVVWEFVITDSGKGKNARFWYNNVLIDADGDVMENTLWSFRGVLQALEPRINIPDKLMKIPFEKLTDRAVALEIGDDEDNEGNIRSEIIDVFHPSLLEDEEDDEDEEDEDDEEEEDWDDEDEDEEEDDEEEEDFHDMDAKRLRSYAREQGIKVKGKKKAELIEELEDLEEEEEDDEEEDDEDEFDLEEDEI